MIILVIHLIGIAVFNKEKFLLSANSKIYP